MSLQLQRTRNLICKTKSFITTTTPQKKTGQEENNNAQKG
jgi:hypothetical protein